MKGPFLYVVLLTNAVARIFDFGAHMIPHPAKADRGGQDAFFASQDVLAVADGVGGWANQGIDPGDYARQLCNMFSFSKQCRIRDEYYIDRKRYLSQPKLLIINAQQNNKQLGSATLTVLTLHPQKPSLIASYIGDSGFAVFRLIDQAVQLTYKSVQQQHEFNFPFQLAAEDMGDPPERSIQLPISIHLKDIVVLGTDGLFDNVELDEIIGIIQNSVDLQTGMLKDKQKVAEQLAQLGHQHGKDKNYDSPFSKEATGLGLVYQGGKLDDTTVIVAQILDDPIDRQVAESDRMEPQTVRQL